MSRSQTSSTTDSSPTAHSEQLDAVRALPSDVRRGLLEALLCDELAGSTDPIPLSADGIVRGFLGHIDDIWFVEREWELSRRSSRLKAAESDGSLSALGGVESEQVSQWVANGFPEEILPR
jgi:hypothetical protein